ncbi:hypothetical protein ASPBRDRAFT_42881 [Aspergillus brasiliensis CBS 101740]|uniref:Uncharacterized protein n=1 Tax=Aspergillus brasiliensis (strain CBS 101740 / IMI 381727 / IBT 21946) TaxID=767769 RepID=A0A1L9UIP6_ASPBC|nr:hypothetical protein ASPBRDRAFT_42881 [Aspergillus brasiliensis CBS 101740]
MAYRCLDLPQCAILSHDLWGTKLFPPILAALSTSCQVHKPQIAFSNTYTPHSSSLLVPPYST